MGATPPSQRSGVHTVATHRKAFRDYHILDRLEAGLELRGAEVKSIREGRFSLTESYAAIEGSEVHLLGLHIQPYGCARAAEQDPLRPKRLLLHRREIVRLASHVALKGQTLVPLRVYFKKGRAKVELALARGKQDPDKREAMRRRADQREADRAIAARTRRG